jgi:hypothetical protein
VKTFGRKEEKVTGERRNRIEVHMRWVGHVAKFWLENLKGRDHSEDLGIDGMIILEWLGK